MPSRRFAAGGKAILAASAALAALLALSCIERSNPFDPANQGTSLRGQSPDEVKASLDSLAKEAEVLGKALAGYRARYQDVSDTNAAREASNAATRVVNDARASANAVIAVFNSVQIDLDSLRLQTAYDLLQTLAAYASDDGFASRRARLQFLAAEAARRMADANVRYAPLEVFSQSYQDSVLAPLVRNSDAYASFQATLDSAHARVAEGNPVIKAYNSDRAQANLAVRDFNEQVAHLKLSKTHPIISRPDSLEKATQAAQPGDTLVLAPGSLPVELRFASGAATNPIVIRGAPGHATILRPKPLGDSASNHTGIIQGFDHIRFEGVVFRGGLISAFKVESQSQGISFHRCIFDSSRGRGLEVIDSDVELVDCEIRANRGDGLRVAVSLSEGNMLHMHNVLIAGNGGHGLDAVSISGDINQVTVAFNSGSGIRHFSPHRRLTITNSIFHRNGELGIYRQPTSLNQEEFQVRGNFFWMNGSGNWEWRELDSAKVAELESLNRTDVEPVFVDPQTFDYALVFGNAIGQYPPPIVIGYRRRP